MSVRYGLLGLLRLAPAHGYQLRTHLLGITGATWPLNIGQVYSTLQRLERDGLIEPDDADPAEGLERRRYRITKKGTGELEGWLTDAVPHESSSRSELVIKVAVAMSLPGTEVRAVLDAQRAATLTVLQGLTKIKRATDDKVAALAVEWMVLGAEAEIRWLDLCEAELTETESRGST
jgi:DNA-binding PadR family transcriptional regulator